MVALPVINPILTHLADRRRGKYQVFATVKLIPMPGKYIGRAGAGLMESDVAKFGTVFLKKKASDNWQVIPLFSFLDLSLASSSAFSGIYSTMNRIGRHPHKNLPDFSTSDGAEEEVTTADHVFYLSSDGLRRQEERLNLTHKKRRVKPSELEDSYAQWIPVNDDGFEDEEMAGGAREDDGEEEERPTLGKRKEYASTVHHLPAFSFSY
jgi:hypothetical protein